MSTTTNIDTLKINYLTQAQYNTAAANNQINENELYLTPDIPTDVVEAYNITTQTEYTANWLRTSSGSITPELGKIYTIVGSNDGGSGFSNSSNYLNNQYRWNGTAYIQISYSTLRCLGAITGQAPSDVSVASGGSWVELIHFSIPAGIWLVTFAASFPNNSSGYRAITLGTSTATAGTVVRTLKTAPANGTNTVLALTAPVEGGSTYYLNAAQTSGSTLSVAPRYTMLKIADAIYTTTP